MQGSEIRNLVVVKMEEYTPYGPSSTPLLAGGDQLNEVKPVYSYIDQTLAEAANEILLIAPIHRIVSKEADVMGIADKDDRRIGIIPMPTDFLRLHTLRMVGWSKPIHETIHEGDPAYSLQFVRWTRGTKQKPAATITGIGEAVKDTEGLVENHFINLPYTEMDSEGYGPVNMEVDEEGFGHFADGCVLLHYYSVDAADLHQVREFKYIQCFDESRFYDRSVAEAIALNCARKIYEIYGQTDQVNTLTNELNAVIENLKK